MSHLPGGQKGNQNAIRHGLNALMARVKLRGLHAIDRRTAGSRSLHAWGKAMVADLGGEAALSSQQRALIDVAVRTRLYLDHLDAWLLEQPSLITRRKRETLPVLTTRQQLADALSRYLAQLGLGRITPDPPDLARAIRDAQERERKANHAG